MPLNVIKIIRDTENWSINSENISPDCLYPVDQGVTSVTNGWSPNTDIFETDNSVVLRIELAGVDREKLSIKSCGNTLIINGMRDDTKHEGRVYYHQMEISYGPFEKVILLPRTLQERSVSANYNDGILEIFITKESATIEIPIETENENT